MADILWFSSKRVGETVTIGFDLVNLLVTGETLGSTTFTATVISGTDPSPSGLISGSASVVGSEVSQKITGGVDGVVYEIRAEVDTSVGHTFIPIARIKVYA